MNDFRRLGLVEGKSRLVSVQPKGNQTIVRALLKGTPFEKLSAVKRPESIASGLLDPFPWDGDAALRGVRETNGLGVAVSDEEIAAAMKILASNTGIFAEASGAAGLAGVKKLREEGKLDKSDKVVVLVTASGLKESQTVTSRYFSADLDAPLVEPNFEDVRAAIERET